MIDAATFKFLRELSKNNDKEWFEAHCDRYDTLLENLTDVAATLIDDAASYDEAVAGLDLDPKKCISRVHRDMRPSRSYPAPASADTVWRPSARACSGLSASASWRARAAPSCGLVA
ncbi:DUF2461 family protein [Sphingomonas sp. PP-CE-1G-424]|uniref:DUF2461 family protein n=1 Tax=Sphingomonas sp. PP-CE-1G-424 TaxID=2135658 RepID=UPI001055DA1D|nr:DUF2461 family protein [Sphingomonas sp. PP-CE-1G-424]TCP66580.1 uncharacterized protein DUF2461 [Sphingomonas sp. PP-CE-1G-424]